MRSEAPDEGLMMSGALLAPPTISGRLLLLVFYLHPPAQLCIVFRPNKNALAR